MCVRVCISVCCSCHRLAVCPEHAVPADQWQLGLDPAPLKLIVSPTSGQINTHSSMYPLTHRQVYSVCRKCSLNSLCVCSCAVKHSAVCTVKRRPRAQDRGNDADNDWGAGETRPEQQSDDKNVYGTDLKKTKRVTSPSGRKMLLILNEYINVNVSLFPFFF